MSLLLVLWPSGIWLTDWVGVTVWCCEGTDWLIGWVLLSDVVKGLTDWLDGCYCMMLWRDWLTDWMGVTAWCCEGTNWLIGWVLLPDVVKGLTDWLIGWVLLADVVKELMDFEMLGSKQLTAECHTSRGFKSSVSPRWPTAVWHVTAMLKKLQYSDSYVCCLMAVKK